jgi:hypothetical protein
MLEKTTRRVRARKRVIAGLPHEIEDMLRELGEDPAAPDWESAFIGLTHLYRRLSDKNEDLERAFFELPHRYSPAVKGRGKWDEDSQFLLIREVALLRRRGLSEREALRKIAGDPRKMALFPYAEQRGRYDLKEKARARAAEALRQQLQHIKRTAERRGSEHVRRMLLRHLAGEYHSKSLDLAANGAEQRRESRQW